MLSLKSLCLALLALATAAAASRSAFAPKMHRKVLEIRGGAGPLDPKTAGKVISVVSIAQGTLATVAPKLSNEQYGLSEEDNDEVAQYFAKDTGTGILSHGVMAYCLFFEDTSLRRAVQASNVLWTYEMLRNILSGYAVRGGIYNTASLKFSLAIFVFTAFAMTQDYADTVIKATSILLGLSGLQCIFAPESAAGIWYFDKDKLNELNKEYFREFGILSLSSAVFTGSIVLGGATNTEALGYSVIPWLLWILRGVLFGSGKKLGMKEEVMWFWMAFWLLFYAVIAGTTLL